MKLKLKSDLERLVLNKYAECTSQHIKWTSRARVMIFLLSVDARSIARSVCRSLGRSVARSLARSVDRSVARSLVRSIARSVARSLDLMDYEKESYASTGRKYKTLTIMVPVQMRSSHITCPPTLSARYSLKQ